MKIFKFDHNEGAEILVANNAKEAIVHYFTKYQDDIITDDICVDGIKIVELHGVDINKKYEVFNEEQGNLESVSYKELAEAAFVGQPVVIITPNY